MSAGEFVQKRRRGAPDANKNRETHGLYVMKAGLKALGSRAIDGRTTTGRALAAWNSEIIRDIGGLESLSAQEIATVDLCVRNKFILDSIDAWIVGQTSLVNARKKSLHPIVLERQQIADSLLRSLTLLGLEKRKPKPKSLQEIIADRERERLAAAQKNEQPALPTIASQRPATPAERVNSIAPPLPVPAKPAADLPEHSKIEGSAQLPEADFTEFEVAAQVAERFLTYADRLRRSREADANTDEEEFA
jgi:hypothetical protein